MANGAGSKQHPSPGNVQAFKFLSRLYTEMQVCMVAREHNLPTYRTTTNINALIYTETMLENVFYYSSKHANMPRNLHCKQQKKNCCSGLRLVLKKKNDRSHSGFGYCTLACEGLFWLAWTGIDREPHNRSTPLIPDHEVHLTLICIFGLGRDHGD